MNPGQQSIQDSIVFNEWLKDVLVGSPTTSTPDAKQYLEDLIHWEDRIPEGRMCHPREEHLLPLFVAATAGGNEGQAKLIFDTTAQSSMNMLSAHAVTGYLLSVTLTKGTWTCTISLP